MLRSVIIVFLITTLAVACSSTGETSETEKSIEESSVSAQDEAPIEDAAEVSMDLGEFVTASDMMAKRERYAALLLSDGRVLAVGGRGLGIGTLIATMHETAELLDPETLESGDVPGLYLAGSVSAGYETGNVFIENGRFDCEKIFADLERQLG